jgi:hypothetical protein
VSTARLGDVVKYIRRAMSDRKDAAVRVRADTSDPQARHSYQEANDHVHSLLIAHQHMIADVIEAVSESDQDVSPCGLCGTPTLCIPDGLPCCDACAKKEKG